MPMPTVLVLSCLVLSLTLGSRAVEAGDSSQALRIARQNQARWTIGPVTVRDRDGRVSAQAALMADGIVIAYLRLDPRTGEFVGDRAYTGAVDPETLARSKVHAARALSQVQVGGWAWPAEHARAWRVPLQYKGRAVGSVTVDVERNRLLGKGERDESEGEE
jgi:hypothetical protein